MLAWCSGKNNKIRVVEITSEQDYANFDGIQIYNKDSNYNEAFHSFNLYEKLSYKDFSQMTHVRGIPNTQYVVSLHHYSEIGANLAVFDLANKEKVKKVYSFEEVLGGKFSTS